VPLVVPLCIATLAGLLAGFGEVALPVAGSALAAALAWGSRQAYRRADALAVALLLSAAAWRGDLVRRADAACRDTLVRWSQWDVVIGLDRVVAGGRAKGTAEGSGCRVWVSLAVREGHAAPGARVRVTGRAAPTPHGFVVEQAVVVPRGGRDGFVALRARAAASLDTLFGARAPLARALLVADTRDLDTDLRDRFADAGLVHALSISGLHVAIVAQALTLLFGALRAGATLAGVAGLAATAGYVIILGAPPPAVRAAVMLAGPIAARLLQRPTSRWAVLGWGALLPLLLDPANAVDIGYQLSVGGMAALVASGALARRLVGGRWHGWRATVARELVAGTAVAALSAPLGGWHVGRVSLVAPVTNLVANPVIALLQPALFVTLAAVPSPPVARVAAAGTAPLLAAFDAIAAGGARVPGAAVTVALDPVAGGLAGVAAALAGAAMLVPRLAARFAVAALAALAALAWRPAASRHGWAELHVLDVGQGDALALRTPRGRWVLVDAGPAWTGGDAGRSVVVPYLRRRGGDVAAVVLSHPDADHAGGLASVVAQLPPALVLDPGYASGSAPYRAGLAAIRKAGAAWRRARAGDTLVVDGVELAVLAPDSASATDAEGPNDASVVLMVRVGSVRWLLPGDAEAPAEARLVAAWGERLRADVLKAGHHGSRTSSTAELRAMVRPRVALVSVGRRNRYGHPDRGVLAALARDGAALFRTDRLGHVIVRTDGERLEVEAAGERWPVPRR
jgi:competence protein ComEC